MTRHTLLGLALASLTLLHCAGDEQSLGANQAGASDAGASGSSGQSGAGNTGGSAGSAPSTRRICDGLDGLTLGYRIGGGEPVGFEQSVSSELGFSYLYVDGHCQFWVYQSTSIGYAPTHAGTLTATQEAQLAADVGYDQWDSVHGSYEKPGGSGTIGVSTSLTFDRTWQLSCGSLCRDDAPVFVKNLEARMQQWISDLYPVGTDVTTPMRIRAQEFSGVPSAYTPLAWTLATPLGSVLLSSASSVVRLTEPADLVALRQLRSSILAFQQEHPGDPGGFYVEQTSPLVRTSISFRDTIPLEDEHGLLPAP